MKRTKQILMRCTESEKNNIQQAVEKTDTTITEFMLVPAVKKANKILKQKP